MSATLYTTADQYPTAPIPTFPPPLPADRIPLRVRCGVTMRLHLSTHGLANGASWPSPKGHVQPQRAHLPRRRNPRRVVLHEHEEGRVAAVTAVEPKVEELAAVVEVTVKEEEEKVIAYWREIDAFQTSLKLSEGRPEYTFYDGPPFATGLPHYGHLLAGTIKVRHIHLFLNPS